jgi:hypothetical protein
MHGEMRNAFKIVVGKPEGKNHLEDLGIDGRIILKLILWKWGGSVWIRFIWFGTGNCGRLL